MSSFMSPCFPSLNLRWSLPRSWTKRKCSILIILWAVTMCRPTIITTAPSCRNSTACCLRFLQATIPAWVCPRLRLRITDGTYIDNERLAARVRGSLPPIYSNCGIPRSRIETTLWPKTGKVFLCFYSRSSLLMPMPPSPLSGMSASSTAAKKQLMELGRRPYRDMLCHFFPRLRRLEVSVRWNIRAVSVGEAYQLIYTSRMAQPVGDVCCRPLLSSVRSNIVKYTK